MAALIALASLAGESQGAAGDVAPARSPAAPGKERVEDSECLKCHGKAGFGRKQGRDLFVDWRRLAESAHGSLLCVDCHSQLVAVPHEPFSAREVDCRRCHMAAASAMRLSAHGVAMAKGDAKLPACVDCHGGHGIAPLAKGAVALKRQLVDACIKCHTSEAIVARYNLQRSDVIVAFKKSTHALAQSGAKAPEAPVCGDCHGAHWPGLADKGQSKPRKAALCGRCHGTELAQWEGSVHAGGAEQPDAGTVGCSDCHSEHRVRLWATKPASATRSARPCGTCHEPRVVKATLRLKAALAPGVGAEFHGMTTRFGAAYASRCESCHGYHDVRLASHPFSRVNERNLASSCGSCHEATLAEFKALSVHGPRAVEARKAAWVAAMESPWIWPAAIGVATIMGFIVVFFYSLVARLTETPELRLPRSGRPR